MGTVEQRLTSRLQEELKSTAAMKHFQDIRDRLQTEVGALGRRGNLNLYLGTSLTLLAITTLIMTSLRAPFQQLTTAMLLSYYIPRVSLVVFIELFAYFFLRLYKTSLSDIKYFQNELTNVGSRFAALTVALDAGDPQLLANVLTDLAKTERNFILKKDETTIELEKARLEQQTWSDAGGILNKLADKIPSRTKKDS